MQSNPPQQIGDDENIQFSLDKDSGNLYKYKYSEQVIHYWGVAQLVSAVDC